MDLKIGFIGGGNMSTAIAEGIFKNNVRPPSMVWVSGPNIENLKIWSNYGANVTTSNGVVLYKCEVVFLGVKPLMLRTALKECTQTLPHGVSLKDVASKETLYVSMLVGITLDEIYEVLKELGLATGAKVIRILPNTPMTVGAGACVLTPGHNATCLDCELITNILSPFSLCQQIPESQMNAFGALIGSGPAFMYIVIDALADASVKQGIARKTAIKFASQMVMGSAMMVLQSGKHPGQLKDEVCSPGGTTICGVAALEDGCVRATLMKAIEASTNAAKELTK